MTSDFSSISFISFFFNVDEQWTEHPDSIIFILLVFNLWEKQKTTQNFSLVLRVLFKERLVTKLICFDDKVQEIFN